MRARCLVLAVALLGVGCNRAPDPTAVGEQAPASTERAAPANGPAVVDLCRSYLADAPVCALLGDGRVTCAHVQAERFEPPLAGIREAVEIACGELGVCIREASGVVTCLDAAGELRRPEFLARARSLAPNCAVVEAGAVACWDVDWNIDLVPPPQLAAALGCSDAEKHALLRVALRSAQSNEDGCALLTSGAATTTNRTPRRPYATTLRSRSSARWCR